MAATTETMAGTAPDANPVERLRQAFNRLGEQQKMIFLVGVAALIAVVVGSILWSRQPDWKVLFSNLNEKDVALEQTDLTREELDRILDPRGLTEGGIHE